jgi:hypothetical protein
MSKTCTKCGQVKNLIEFSKGKNGKFGLQAKCKECKKLESKKWRENNPDYGSQHYQNNKEQYNLLGKQRYENNKEEILLKQKIQNNTPEAKQKHKQWREDNKDHIRSYDNNRKKDPIKGPLLKLHDSVFCGIRRGMKYVDGTKNQSSLKILGLENWDKFREHVESHWEEGMNWNNYGNKENQWSIDHTIPISSALNENEVYKLNHYTNLKPMWHLDNIKKNNKI